MSEPVIPLPPQGFKQEMVDPRYPEQGVTNVAATRVPSFHQMSIKQEPREFGIDSGEHYMVAGHFVSGFVSLFLSSTCII